MLKFTIVMVVEYILYYGVDLTSIISAILWCFYNFRVLFGSLDIDENVSQGGDFYEKLSFLN